MYGCDPWMKSSGSRKNLGLVSYAEGGSSSQLTAPTCPGPVLPGAMGGCHEGKWSGAAFFDIPVFFGVVHG